MTFVNSLHSGDPDVPDVLAAGRYLSDALQLHAIRPTSSCCSCNTCTGGNHVVNILCGSAIICRCSEVINLLFEQLFSRVLSFHSGPASISITGRAMSFSGPLQFRMEMTLVKSLHIPLGLLSFGKCMQQLLFDDPKSILFTKKKLTNKLQQHGLQAIALCYI